MLNVAGIGGGIVDVGAGMVVEVPLGTHAGDCQARGIPYGGSRSGRGVGCAMDHRLSLASRRASSRRSIESMASVETVAGATREGVAVDVGGIPDGGGTRLITGVSTLLDGLVIVQE